VPAVYLIRTEVAVEHGQRDTRELQVYLTGIYLQHHHRKGEQNRPVLHQAGRSKGLPFAR
jgi:hypothetical protein